MKRSKERILTTHAGSLPRPDDLLEMVYAREESRPVSEAAFAARARSAVREVVEQQVAAGIDVVSDGEVSKSGFVNYVKDRFDGFDRSGSPTLPMQVADVADFPELFPIFGTTAAQHINTPACTGDVVYRDRQQLDADIANLKAALEGVQVEEAFICATSPACVAQVHANAHYPTRETYLAALADALRIEYRAITDAGFLLQIDCPDIGMGHHVSFPDLSVAEYRRVLEGNVEALNHALEGIDPERVRVHVCWGNYPGPHHHDIPLRDVIDVTLKIRGSAFSIEAANPRHEHEWQVFKDVKLPDGTLLIPGVIDIKTNYIEHPELVAERLERFASVVGRENVIAGTDCGFGTFAGWGVPARLAYAKLRAMADGAKLASERLWGLVATAS